MLAENMLLAAGASVKEMSPSWSWSWSESGRVDGTGGEEGGDFNSSFDPDLDLDFVFDLGSLVGISCTSSRPSSRPSSRLASTCFRFLLEVLWPESACFRFFVLCDGLCSSSREGCEGDCDSAIRALTEVHSRRDPGM